MNQITQLEFWMLTLIVSTVVGLLIWMFQRQAKKRDVMDKELIESMTALKEGIFQLKITITSLTSGCRARHEAISKDLDEIRSNIDHINNSKK